MSENLNSTLAAATVMMVPDLCVSNHSNEAFLNEIKRFNPNVFKPVQSVPGTQSANDAERPSDLAKAPLASSMQVTQRGAPALKVALREDATRESARFLMRVFLEPTEIHSQVCVAHLDNLSQVLDQLKCTRAEVPVTETSEMARASAGAAPASDWVLSFVALPPSAIVYALHNLHFEHTAQLRAKLQRVLRLDDDSEDSRHW